MECAEQWPCCQALVAKSIVRINEKQWTAPSSARVVRLWLPNPLLGSMKNNGMHRPRLSCHGRGARGEGTFTSDFVPPFPAHLHERVVGACPPGGDHAVALGVDIGGRVAGIHP